MSNLSLPFGLDAAAAGVSPDSLKKWILKGHFRATPPRAAGEHRRFTEDDVVAFAVASRMVDALGMPIASAARIANALRRKDGRVFVRPRGPHAVHWVVTATPLGTVGVALHLDAIRTEVRAGIGEIDG